MSWLTAEEWMEKISLMDNAELLHFHGASYQHLGRLGIWGDSGRHKRARLIIDLSGRELAKRLEKEG